MSDPRAQGVWKATEALRRLGRIGHRLLEISDRAPHSLGPDPVLYALGDDVDRALKDADRAWEDLTRARAEIYAKESR